MEVVILGGGVSGLACAVELQRRGADVTVVERASSMGGLARTIEHEGYRFDLGGHRFHSNNPEVVAWIRGLLGHDLIPVQRRSRIRLNDAFVDYPLQLPSALSAFAPLQSIGMAASYVAARATSRFRRDVTFEDWVVNRFGRALHEAFFRPYTEKVWGLACDEISADWAAQRIGLPSLLRAVRQAFAPHEERLPTSVTEFLYPRRGFGMITDALTRELAAGGARLLTSTRPFAIAAGIAEVGVSVTRADGTREHIGGDWLISTIDPPALLTLLQRSDASATDLLGRWTLAYRGVICLFLGIARQRVSSDHWTYFPDGGTIFGRTHEPKNWSSEMVPSDDVTSLVVEIFASQGDEVWSLDDDVLTNRTVKELAALGVIDERSVLTSRTFRVPHAYPVYRVGYRESLDAYASVLSKHPRISVAGRTGAFRYLNSDGVIENAIETVQNILPSESPLRSLAEQQQRWA